MRVCGLPPQSMRDALIMSRSLSAISTKPSAGFYASLLGVQLKEQGNNDGPSRWCILGAPDRFYLCLVEVPSVGGFSSPEGTSISTMSDFVVDDIDETVRRVHDLGLRLGFNDLIV